MDLTKYEEQINKIFLDSDYRQIVMWYDESKEFEEEIESFNLENAELFLLKEDNWIYTKYYIESEHPNTNFLVYAPFRKPSDEDNYLADMVHYAYLYSAEKIDMYLNELGLSKEYKDIVSKYSSFWNAASRINAFKALNIREYTNTTIEMGILTVLAKEKTINFDYIVRKVIIKHFEEDYSIIDSFTKFNIIDSFWDFVYQKFGYREDNPTVDKMTVSLILNYTASLFEGNPPKSWERFLIEDKNNPRVFIDNFMNNTNYMEVYDSIAAILEEKLKIRSSISQRLVDSYEKCDSFEIFDKNIIFHYVNLLYENKEKLDLDNVLEYREKTHFYRKYENEYQAIYWANNFIYLINEFQREILPDDINELIELFSTKFVKVDKSYRKFYYYFDKIDNTEIFENLRSLIENMYTNTFLFEINPKFVNLFENLEDISIPKQWKFYKRYVAGKKYRTVVIISDALRYGCAIELKDELDRNPNWKTTIEPMLSTVPSYTALGMASLLPHKEVKYENSKILIDGKPCQSTEERNKILNSYNNNSIAVQYDELNSLNRADLRNLLKGKDLVYIYHNQIDARGDNSYTENEVFNASQEAIDEIVNLVNKLTNNVNFVRYIITADHGYIYKRDKLKESSKVNLEKLSTFYKNKRFLLTDYETDIAGTKCINLKYIGNNNVYATVPVGVDVFKTPGSGLNYVHGGLSLEEVIIPVLEVNTKQGPKNQRTVELQLINSLHKLTNYTTNLTFFQKENISKTVLPLEASIFFVDEEGNKISNEGIIFADRNSDYAEDRQFKEKFTLKRIAYSKNKKYYLVMYDAKTDMEINRIEYLIDIAFQDEDSFF